MTWIYALPSWLFFIMVVVGMAMLAGCGLLLFRRVIPIREELAFATSGCIWQ